MKAILTISQKSHSDFIQALAWILVSPFEKQGFTSIHAKSLRIKLGELQIKRRCGKIGSPKW
jgi:hypothetical protein